MSESAAVEAPAAKEPFFKMSSIPGANILVPLLLGCLPAGRRPARGRFFAHRRYDEFV